MPRAIILGSVLRLAAAALIASWPADAQRVAGIGMPTAGASPAASVSGSGSPSAGTGADGGMSGMRAPSPGVTGSMPAMAGMPGMEMEGLLGRHPMAREGSGTSWEPDSSPTRGYMFSAGGWSLMGQGYVTGIYDHQGGARGDAKTFSNSMFMLMASRDLSAADRLGLRAMLSLDPAMGASGYPLLFATGETADGRVPLVDRQHPHDLFMELAVSLAHDLGAGGTFSVYAGLPGEPALGPPTFMHRISGMDDPEAPIGHHWFDSTHITYGVVTAGYSTGRFKLEASGFKGREPDQHRWDIERPRLDSWSVRLSWNPRADLSLQVSSGRLRSPEQLEPARDEQRTTASVTYNRPLGSNRNWATTIAWSLKDGKPGPKLTGLLAETALRLGRDEVYARAEREQENELFADVGGPLGGRIFDVGKLSLGYQHEVPLTDRLFFAIGGLASAYTFADALRPSYGHGGVKSFVLYGRLRFGA